VSEAVPNIMRAKYRKLLMNLANPLDALVLEGEDTGDLHRRARHEAEACFAAAGIEYATAEEDRARREGVLRVTSLEGRPRGGGSTWQSLVRGSGTTEVDWLNGEVVLLGRLHGVPTPVNAMLQAATRDAARRGTAPRSLKVADLEALIDG
jgi:2-dehydropantoate 2-reductase